jgi:hypothetical protein
MGASVGDGVVALACVVGIICGDRPDSHINGALAEQLGEYRRIPDVASGYLDSMHLQRLFIDADMDLVP